MWYCILCSAECSAYHISHQYTIFTLTVCSRIYSWIVSPGQSENLFVSMFVRQYFFPDRFRLHIALAVLHWVITDRTASRLINATPHVFFLLWIGFVAESIHLCYNPETLNSWLLILLLRLACTNNRYRTLCVHFESKQIPQYRCTDLLRFYFSFIRCSKAAGVSELPLPPPPPLFIHLCFIPPLSFAFFIHPSARSVFYNLYKYNLIRDFISQWQQPSLHIHHTENCDSTKLKGLMIVSFLKYKELI